MNVKRLCSAAVLTAFVAAGVTAALADGNIVFRSRPMLLSNGGSSPVNPGEGTPQEPEEDLSVSVSMSVPEPFGLTQGEAVTIPLAVSGNTTDVNYEAAADASMPGLSVDSSTGEVTGTPSGVTGTVYKISVAAVRNGETVAQDSVTKTLRDALTVPVGPADIRFIHGDSFPSTAVFAQSSGGDAASVTWTIEDAPEWLEIVQDGDTSHAKVQVKDEYDIEEFASSDVTVVATDGEGRRAERSFVLAVMPGPEALIPSVSGNNYGVSSSVSGDTAVVGAYTGDSVFVFHRNPDNSWSEVQKLTGTANSWFGYSVALRDDMLVVGAGSTSGQYAKVYKKQPNGTFNELQTLTGSGRFGYSVAADGNKVVIGAWQNAKAYVYEIQPNGTLGTTPTATLSGASGSYFGDSLAVDGDTIFVGAYYEGSMTVYSRATGVWTQVSKFTGTGKDVSGGLFGYRVAVKGDIGFFSHVKDNFAGTDAGSVWVVERQPDGTWATVKNLTASNPSPGARFGQSVAFDGEVAIIGALKGDHAYAFRKSGGTWIQSSILEIPASYSTLSVISVSMSNDKALVSLGGTGVSVAYVLPTP